MSFSPRSISRSGFPSGVTSVEIAAGIQNSLKNSPVGVPGPTLVNESTSKGAISVTSLPPPDALHYAQFSQTVNITYTYF